MRLLPNIAGTVANWGLQGTLVDSSGNGLTLATQDGTHSPFPIAGGTEKYKAFDSCIQGFSFNGSTQLIAPASSLLQLVGSFTAEWLMIDVNTPTHSYFMCEATSGFTASQSPDRIGHLMSYYWSASNSGFTDQNTSESVPGPATYVQFTGGTSSPNVFGFHSIHAYAVRRVQTGATATLDLFVDGARIAPSITKTAANVAVGNERFFLGGASATGFQMLSLSGVDSGMAGFRLTALGLSDATILADAQYMFNPCGAFLNYRGVRVRMQG